MFPQFDNHYLLALQSGLGNEVQTENLRDKEAFFNIVNMLLWNASEGEESEERQYGAYFRRQGLLNRPMPIMIRRQDSLGGGMYRSLVDQCYGIMCSLGLSGLFESIERLLI